MQGFYTAADLKSAAAQDTCKSVLTCFLQAYGKTRLQGSDEIGEVLLNISSELLTFDFKETFVNAFDVS